jgi:hypothetical protein
MCSMHTVVHTIGTAEISVLKLGSHTQPIDRDLGNAPLPKSNSRFRHDTYNKKKKKKQGC